MFETLFKSWQVPSWEASNKAKLGWLNEACEDGQSWQKAQRGYKDWQKALEIISGDESARNLLKYRSQLSGSRLKTNIRVAVAGLSNIKPIWGWHAQKTYAKCATMLNKTARALYLEGYWDQDIKAALLWASVTGVGFIRPVYRRESAGRGKGNIFLDTYGAPSVCPVQMPANGKWNNAYAVTLLDEQPIWMAHGMFPDFQDQLKPTTSRYWYSSEIRTAAEKNQEQRSQSWWGRKRSESGEKMFIPIRYTRVNDLSVNTSGKTWPMGQPGSSWYYEVPSLGAEISDNNGGTKQADMNDARMYPYGRLLISSEDCLMYDGPGFNWHGELDLTPFYLDWWPWEPMGLSPVHEGWELQKSLDEIDRGSMNKVRIDLDRPLAYNLDVTTKKQAESFDPLEPRARIAYDGSQGDKPFTSPVEDSFFQITATTLQVRELLQSELDYQLQTRDIVELSKARALGKGMDQLEALIAANGPLVKDTCRSMEASIGRVVEQVGSLVLQWMDTARMMQYVGQEGMVSEVFDYNPSSLIPSHMPSEETHDQNTQAPIASKYSRLERARWFEGNIRFFLLPHSAHEIQQMTERLLLIQLKQRGAPISWATVMQACEVADVGIPDGNTEQEKFKAEKEDEIVMMARAQEIVKGLGIDPSAMGGGGKQHAGGRPPSGKAAPQIESKDGGTRSTVSESRAS